MGDFTHFNEDGNAKMVDVSEKNDTKRIAVAKGRVVLNEETYLKIKDKGMKKGDVLGTAQIAGIMAAKKTADIIPMCHPLFIDGIDIKFELCEPGKEEEQEKELDVNMNSIQYAYYDSEFAEKEDDEEVPKDEGWSRNDSNGTGEVSELKNPERDNAQVQTENVTISEDGYFINIESTVKCTGPTGVEMEALTAVSVAALTIYDMCKAVQKDIRIEDIHLEKKSGGKSGNYEIGVGR